MNILLVANKGKLNSAVESQIQKDNNIFLYLVNKDSGLSELIEAFHEVFLQNKLDLIIFISGETRDENKMMLLNYLFPKEILRISQSNNLPLIYLSSLSVFGIPSSKSITNYSQKKSIDLYSTTKNLFDSFARDNCVKALVLSIMPGSIVNFRSKNDILNKLIKFSKTFPNNLFLKRFHPRGNIACIEVNDLAKAILFEVKNLSRKDFNIGFESKICTANLSISKVLKYIFLKESVFLLPNLSFLKSKNLSLILEKVFLKKLVLFFNDTKYESSYDLSDESYFNHF